MIAVACGIKGCNEYLVARHSLKNRDFMLCQRHSEMIFLNITEDLIVDRILAPESMRGAREALQRLRRRRPSQKPLLMEKLGLDN